MNAKVNTKIYALILCLNSFSAGILVPILTLLFINKGLTLGQVSIIMGVYSSAIIVLEVPSGIMADLLGRKKVFSFSLFSLVISLFIIFTFNNFISILFAIVFYGISRAFSSGSLDALYIDWCNELYGKENLSKIMTNLLVLETAGLAFGAIIGGILPDVCQAYFKNINMYTLNILCKIILTFILALLTIIFIKEYKLPSNTDKKINLKLYLINNISILQNNRPLLLIFISLFSTGFFLMLLETYWQPQLLNFLPDHNMIWILGIVSCLYFIFNMIGSILSNYILKIFRLSPYKLYKLSRFTLSLSVILLIFQNNFILFIIFYCLTYLIFGIANVPEGIIINSLIPAANRASILSFSSLAIEIGSLIASFTGSILINYISISEIWLIGGISIYLSIILFKETQTIKTSQSLIKKLFS